MRKSIYSQRHECLCALLIAARKEVGVTQSELATRLAKPQSFIAKLEGGERRLDVLEFIDIAIALEIDPVHLLRSLIRLSNERLKKK